jgi:hypothetical protein
MVTVSRRLVANRLNAQASTGPRTRIGKERSSQNARSHGLTVPSHQHPFWSEPVERLARHLAGPDDTDPIRRELARQAADAYVDLTRARFAETELIARFLKASETPPVSRPADPVDALSQALDVDLRGVIASLRDGLSSKDVERCAAFVEKSAVRITKIQPIKALTPEGLLIKAQRLTRYQRRSLSRWKRALRQLGGTRR